MDGESGTPYLPGRAPAQPAVARPQPEPLFTLKPVTLAELLAETAPPPPKPRRSMRRLLGGLALRRPALRRQTL